MSEILDQIPDVDIDANGVFKYILINVTDKKSKSTKPIVRGYARAPYHGEFLPFSIYNYFIILFFYI